MRIKTRVKSSYEVTVNAVQFKPKFQCVYKFHENPNTSISKTLFVVSRLLQTNRRTKKETEVENLTASYL